MRAGIAVLSALAFSAAGYAGSYNFSDFANPGAFTLVNSSFVDGNTLRLTQAQESWAGGVWLSNQSSILGGFDASFSFRISNIGGWPRDWSDPVSPGGDGLAFVVQDYAGNAIGIPNSGIGYMGIPRSLAIEFDTWRNKPETTNLYCDANAPNVPGGLPVYCEPDANHISVHSLGEYGNRPEHRAVEVAPGVWKNPDLGTTTTPITLEDGSVHTVRVHYGAGSLSIFLDDPNAPRLNVAVDIASMLGLTNGMAWLGVVSATGGAWANHDLVQASTPAPVPEPATWMLSLAGFAIFLAFRKSFSLN